MAKTFNVVDTIEQGFRTVINEPRHMLFFVLPVVLLLGLVVTIGVSAFYSTMAPTAEIPAFMADPMMGIYATVYMGVIYLVFLLGMGASILKADAGLNRKKMGVAEAYSKALSRFPKLIVATILFGVIAGAGMIALVIPGIYLAVRLVLFMPGCMLEKEGLGIKKAWEISKGNFWRLFALMIVLAIISGLLGLFIPIIGMVIAYLFMSPVTAVCYVTAYRKLR
jgi:membrane-anchored glycerophosphoryl diester phosphodiesterase (GDPDase)